MSKWQHLIDKHQAALRSADGIFTWTSQEELAWLAEEASERTDILEIGTYKGHSARVMARANPNGFVTCFDRCSDAGVEAEAKKNLSGERNVELLHSDSGVSAVKWSLAGYKHFDMVWIDDGHTYADVVRDCVVAMLLARRIAVGTSVFRTLICGHDYERPFNDVARAVNDCFGEKNIKFGPGTIWYL